MTWQKLTGPNYRRQNFLERLSMSINTWPMLFGRYSAGNSIFWHIYVRKNFFWSQKIEKIRFFQNRSKSHIYVYSASKTCLGTPKGHFLAIYTYISHYLTLYKKSNFWKKSRFSWNLAILINQNSADSPAGGGRNNDSCPETYSMDILEAFSYSDHHCMMSRLNLMVLWKSPEFPL